MSGNKAIVDIRLRPRCGIPPPLRPLIDSSNACNQASAPIVCTPLHGLVHFAIHRGVRFVGYVFPKIAHYPSGLSPHITHCSSGQAHSSSRTASRSVQPFLYRPQTQCCIMHCQWGKTQNCPISLTISSPCPRRAEPRP